MGYEGLLQRFHGLKERDNECFRALVEAEEPLTVDELAEAVNGERRQRVGPSSGSFNGIYREITGQLRAATTTSTHRTAPGSLPTT
jgi:hypothetical protein